MIIVGLWGRYEFDEDEHRLYMLYEEASGKKRKKAAVRRMVMKEARTIDDAVAYVAVCCRTSEEKIREINGI